MSATADPALTPLHSLSCIPMHLKQSGAGAAQCRWVGDKPHLLSTPGSRDMCKQGAMGEEGYWFLGTSSADSGHSRPHESCIRRVFKNRFGVFEEKFHAGY